MHHRLRKKPFSKLCNSQICCFSKEIFYDKWMIRKKRLSRVIHHFRTAWLQWVQVVKPKALAGRPSTRFLVTVATVHRKVYVDAYGETREPKRRVFVTVWISFVISSCSRNDESSRQEKKKIRLQVYVHVLPIWVPCCTEPITAFFFSIFFVSCRSKNGKHIFLLCLFLQRVVKILKIIRNL